MPMSKDEMLFEAEAIINNDGQVINDSQSIMAPKAPERQPLTVGSFTKALISTVLLPVRMALLAAARILLGRERFSRYLARYEQRDIGRAALNAQKEARREFAEQLQRNIEKNLNQENQKCDVSVKESRDKGYYGRYKVTITDKEKGIKMAFYVNHKGSIDGRVDYSKKQELPHDVVAMFEKSIRASFVASAVSYSKSQYPTRAEEQSSAKLDDNRTDNIMQPQLSALEMLKRELQKLYPDADIDIQEQSLNKDHLGEASVTITDKDGVQTSLFFAPDGSISNSLGEMGLCEMVGENSDTLTCAIADEKTAERFQDLKVSYERCATLLVNDEKTFRENQNLENMLRADLNEKYNADISVYQSINPATLGETQISMQSRENVGDNIVATFKDGQLSNIKMITSKEKESVEFCGVKSLQEVKGDIEQTADEYSKYKIIESNMQNHYDGIHPASCEISVTRAITEHHMGDMEISINDKGMGEVIVAYIDKNGNITNNEAEYSNKEQEFSQEKYEAIKEAGVIARYAQYQEYASTVENINNSFVNSEVLKKQIETSMRDVNNGNESKSIFSQHGIDFIVTQPEKGVYNIEAHIQSDVTSGETRSFGSGINFNAENGFDVPASVITSVDKTILASIESEAKAVDDRYIRELECEHHIPHSNETELMSDFHAWEDNNINEERLDFDLNKEVMLDRLTDDMHRDDGVVDDRDEEFNNRHKLEEYDGR